VALDADRRAQLERARAVALLTQCFDLSPSATPDAAPFGITVRDGDQAWIVSMSNDLAALGGVLVWLDRHAPATAELVVDHHAAVHTRRTAVLAPELRVWESQGDTVIEAVPEPLPPALPRPDDIAHLEELLIDEGLEIVCEDGIVRGELAGLEVARILHGPDGPVLEAGVGRFDREAAALLHAGRSPADALHDAVTQVRPQRAPGAVSHAVNRLGRERWLRHLVVQDPRLAGVSLPELVEPIPPRTNLLEAAPAALLAVDGDARVLVVCSVGVDLGLVPAIADLVSVHVPTEIRIVMPERDRLPYVERLAARLPVPTSFRSINAPWVD